MIQLSDPLNGYDGIVYGVPVMYQVVKMVDVLGITDFVELQGYLMHGDFEAALEAGAVMGVEWAVGAAVGFGAGKVLKGAGKVLSRLARGADEAADGLVAASRIGDNVVGAGWDVETAALAVSRNGDRIVVGQGVGTTLCGPTCIEMVTKTVGKKVDAGKLQPFVRLAGSRPGLFMNEVRDGLEAQGIPSVFTKINGKGLEAITARGTPVVASVRVAGASYRHVVIVDGVTHKPGLGKVVALRDPGGTGSQFFLNFSHFHQKWNWDAVYPVWSP